METPVDKSEQGKARSNMKDSIPLLRRLVSLVSARLGTCPTCMRGSIIGSVAGWSTVAAVRFLWPVPALMSISVAVSAAFTALMVSHVAARMVRVGLMLRDHRIGGRRTVWNGRMGGYNVVAVEQAPRQGAGRRDFALTILRSGCGFAAGALFSLLPARSSFAKPREYCLYLITQINSGANTCPGNVAVGKL